MGPRVEFTVRVPVRPRITFHIELPRLLGFPRTQRDERERVPNISNFTGTHGVPSFRILSEERLTAAAAYLFQVAW